MSILATIALVGQAVGQAAVLPATDTITFEMIVGNSLSGWELASDGRGSFFDKDRVTGKPDPTKAQSFAGPADNFAFASSQLAAYRALASAGAGCAPARDEIFGFRLRWVEKGKPFTATFTDSCGGIPDNFDLVIAPVGKRLDVLLPPPSAPPR